MSEPTLPSAVKGSSGLSTKYRLIDDTIIDVAGLRTFTVWVLSTGQVLCSRDLTSVPANTPSTANISNIPAANILVASASLSNSTSPKLMVDLEKCNTIREELNQKMVDKLKEMTTRVLRKNASVCGESMVNTDKEAVKLEKKLDKLEEQGISQYEQLREKIVVLIGPVHAAEIDEELKGIGKSLLSQIHQLRDELDPLNRGDRKEFRLLMERDRTVWGLEVAATSHRKEIEAVSAGFFENHAKLATPIQAAAADQEAAGGDDDDSPDISPADDSGPNVSGPDVSGPDVSGPDVSGPDVPDPGPDVPGPGPDATGPDDQAPKSGPGRSDAGGKKKKSGGMRHKSKKRHGDNNDPKSYKKTKKTKTTNAAVTEPTISTTVANETLTSDLPLNPQHPAPVMIYSFGRYPSAGWRIQMEILTHPHVLEELKRLLKKNAIGFEDIKLCTTGYHITFSGDISGRENLLKMWAAAARKDLMKFGHPSNKPVPLPLDNMWWFAPGQSADPAQWTGF